MSRLVIVASRPISAWINKGEVVDRYFNPGNIFDEVALLLLDAGDYPDPSALAQMAGRAHVSVWHAPIDKRLFFATAGWRPRLLAPLLRTQVRAVDGLQPDVVRTYGTHLDAFVASLAHERTKVPFCISVHVNADEDVRGRSDTSLRSRIASRAGMAIEQLVLTSADLVLPVYEPIVPYLRARGVKHYRVAYNMINPSNLHQKTEYDLHEAGRVIVVGRQFGAKNPQPIIDAMAEMPGVQLTVVGDGPLHDHLRAVAERTAASDRITFRRRMSNDELCRVLVEHDVAAFHSEYWELSKAVLEALLSGLPVVINERKGLPVPELTNDLVRKVSGTSGSYVSAIARLLGNSTERAALGRRGAEHAWAHWGPERTEEVFASAYRDLLRKGQQS